MGINFTHLVCFLVGYIAYDIVLKPVFKLGIKIYTEAKKVIVINELKGAKLGIFCSKCKGTGFMGKDVFAKCSACDGKGYKPIVPKTPISINEKITQLKTQQSIINEKLSHYSKLMASTTSNQDYGQYAHYFDGWISSSKAVTAEIEMLERMKEASYRTVGNYEPKIKNQTSC